MTVHPDRACEGVEFTRCASYRSRQMTTSRHCCWLTWRDRLIRNRTQLANAIRSYATVYGLIAAKGCADRTAARPYRGRWDAAGFWPRSCSHIHAQGICAVATTSERRRRQNDTSGQGGAIPCVGLPIDASLLVMKSPASETFDRTETLPPGLAQPDAKDHSAAGRIRLCGSRVPARKPCAACWLARAPGDSRTHGISRQSPPCLEAPLRLMSATSVGRGIPSTTAKAILLQIASKHFHSRRQRRPEEQE